MIFNKVLILFFFIFSSINIPIQNLGIWQGELVDFLFEKSSRVHTHGAKNKEDICEAIGDVKTQVLNQNMHISTAIFPISKKQVEFSSLHCCRELQETLTILRQLPEVNELIKDVLKRGPVFIKLNNRFSDRFEGYWDPSDRSIFITITRNTSKEDLLSTLLFELHNAYRESDMQKIDRLAKRNEISKSQYVESIEYIEYQNACSTSKLLEKGIEMGIFPPNCYWKISDTFEEHYRIQKNTGHSAWIENYY